MVTQDLTKKNIYFISKKVRGKITIKIKNMI